MKPSAGINIALFHGALWGSHTDSNWMIQGEERLGFFKKYDFTMLGDIHKCQAMDPEKRIWYCGSTIQQNYGESGEKGFLFWEILSKDEYTTTFYPVKHNNPFVSIEWVDSVAGTLEEAQNHLDGSRFRILSDRQLDPKNQRKLSNTLRREKKALEVVYKIGM
jgi:DNA repair exonuclease SbcCD nuclease subunit